MTNLKDQKKTSAAAIATRGLCEIDNRPTPLTLIVSGTPHGWYRNAMQPRYGQCSPIANAETDRRKLKLVPFVCQTAARNHHQKGFSQNPPSFRHPNRPLAVLPEFPTKRLQGFHLRIQRTRKPSRIGFSLLSIGSRRVARQEPPKAQRAKTQYYRYRLRDDVRRGRAADGPRAELSQLRFPHQLIADAHEDVRAARLDNMPP